MTIAARSVLIPAALCLAAFVSCAGRAADTVVVTGMAKVIDGDTIDIRGQRIRIHGIDAPEAAQTCNRAGQAIPCGQEATEALARKVGQSKVTCTGIEHDQYQRLIAVCQVGGVDVGGWLVEQGRAVAFIRYSQDYIAAEQQARQKKIGIWSTSFVMPWDFRAQMAAAGPAPASPSNATCLIKGNVSAKGERIYHLPGGAMYDKTDIEPDRGERWFCSPQEAEAAGWRASRR